MGRIPEEVECLVLHDLEQLVIGQRRKRRRKRLAPGMRNDVRKLASGAFFSLWHPRPPFLPMDPS
jgi:hypothetical protein